MSLPRRPPAACNPCRPALPVWWDVLGWDEEGGAPPALLLEDGENLLLEDGGLIYLEG